MNNKYPIYVISKGRWNRPLTARSLDEMGIKYNIVIEEQEYDNYSSKIDKEKILVLPFKNLGQGSIPARNWVWDHSLSVEAKRHWILDDNIDGFVRLYRNKKIKIKNKVIFKIAEDFVDRYENVALAGFNYRFFAKQRQVIPPFYLNTRIYSCILIKNDLDYRWRGKYNEDTDLSLRVLKDKWCTILFNCFLCNKQATMTMTGGNTDELYVSDGRLKMAQSLVEQHPDVSKISWKFGRWQHHVDYRNFKENKLKRKDDYNFSNNINEYGIKLFEEIRL